MSKRRRKYGRVDKITPKLGKLGMVQGCKRIEGIYASAALCGVQTDKVGGNGITAGAVCLHEKEAERGHGAVGVAGQDGTCQA